MVHQLWKQGEEIDRLILIIDLPFTNLLSKVY